MSDHATVVPDVAAEVTIETDGTLSRVLHNDDQIRLVVFAFDKGQELTEHTASAAATLQVISGRLRLRLGEESLDAWPGAWVHMPPNLPHSVEALEPSVMLLTLLKA
jgi:quercetin dioxygenase-like cupin family protein